MYGHSWSGNWTGPGQQTEVTQVRKPQKARLRGIFADADAIARRKVR